MCKVNHSWREQAKPVVTDRGESFQSVWMAAVAMRGENGCLHETAKKEIRRALRDGVRRYGRSWVWK